MANIKFSELASAVSLDEDDVLALSHEQGGGWTSLKTKVEDLGNKIVDDMTYANLTSTDKKIVGAINEKVDWESNGVLGAKNLIPYPWFRTSGTLNRGITFTYGEEGYISLDGTADTTNQPYFLYLYNKLNWLKGNTKYRISLDRTNNNIFTTLWFRNSQGQALNVHYQAVYNDGTTRDETSLSFSLNYSGISYEWADITLDINEDVLFQLDLRVPQNSGSYSALTDKARAMVRLAEDTDNTYRPYTMTNKELTDVVNNVPETAGTYTLQAVRNADDTITYSWV